MQYSAMKTIGVVAKREMAVALKSKMVVGTMLLLILGAIIAPVSYTHLTLPTIYSV